MKFELNSQWFDTDSGPASLLGTNAQGFINRGHGLPAEMTDRTEHSVGPLVRRTATRVSENKWERLHLIFENTKTLSTVE